MLGYFCRVRLVILPQAFQRAMPATINQFVITFKETSLVVIIGIFDFMASANAAYQTGVWTPYYREVYALVAAVYFVGAFSLSRYGAYLERRVSTLDRSRDDSVKA
jgi:general L-amino acid transport system permease protein